MTYYVFIFKRAVDVDAILLFKDWSEDESLGQSVTFRDETRSGTYSVRSDGSKHRRDAWRCVWINFAVIPDIWKGLGSGIKSNGRLYTYSCC